MIYFIELYKNKIRKFYDGLTVAKYLQDVWGLTDPELEGRWLQEANVTYWLLSTEWPKQLPPLEEIYEKIQERDKRCSPGAPYNARNYAKRNKKKILV